MSDILGITADQTKSQNPIERKKNKAKQTNKKHPMQGTGGNYSALLGAVLDCEISYVLLPVFLNE